MMLESRTDGRRLVRVLVVVSLMIGALTAPVPGAGVDAFRAAAGQDTTLISPAEQRAVLGRAMMVLRENYVFPDVAERMASSLEARLARGEHSGPVRARRFAEELTEHLYGIGGDRHLWVTVSPGPYPAPLAEPTPEDREARREALRRENFGFRRVEILDGNVGYLEIGSFRDPELAGEAAAAALRFLSNSDALIIDVRRSGGGRADMVLLLASHLFGPEPVHLFDVYRRVEDTTEEYWTLPEVPAERLADQPVFILTHARTFSAPEGLAYTLQQLGRATVVGERTGGGAHPGAVHRLSERFAMFVASARVTSPVTGTNWEGTGVSPDVEVPAEQALETAHALALEALGAAGG